MQHRRGPCEPHSRHELLVVGAVERTAVSVLTGELGGAGLQIHVGLPVRHLVQRLRIFPTQAEIQRQITVDLEIVLEEDAVAPLAMSPKTGLAAASLGVQQVQQEVGVTVPGISSVVSEDTQQSVVTGVEVIFLIADKVEAHFQRVPADQFGEVVGVVKAVVERDAVAGGAAHGAEVPAERDAAGAGDRLRAGNAQRLVAVFPQHAGRVRGAGDDLDARVTHAGFVHGGRRKRVRPVDHAAGGGSVGQLAKLCGQHRFGGAILRVTVN